MLRIFTALWLLSPAIASAQCLTATALDGGITVTYGSGDISYISRQADGSILDALTQSTNRVILFKSIQGVFETSQIAHAEDTWEGHNALALSYDFPANTITGFAAGDRGHGTQTQTDPQYGPTSNSFGWAAYARPPLDIGDCSYQAVRIFTTSVSIRYGSLDIREIIYLPELGIGLQTGHSSFGLSPENSDIISISPT